MLEALVELVGGLLSPNGGNSNSSSGKCNHCGKVVFIVIVFVICFGYFAYQYAAPKIETINLIEKHSKLLCHPPEDGFRQALDGWDVPLRYNKEEIDDPLATKCTVTSAGRDNKFDTDDDQYHISYDIHKAKIVGKWAKETAKDVWKGIISD